MTAVELARVEVVGGGFDEGALLAARDRAWACLRDAAARIVPGTTTRAARALVDAAFTRHGAARSWHPPQIRVGASTQRAFGEPGGDETLTETDLFFLDLGPVFDGHAGDVGAAFAVGDDPDMRRCASDAAALHAELAAAWRSERLTGRALYDRLDAAATARGWKLHRKGATGHRLGDVPASVRVRTPLAALDAVPSAARWVLEVQIHHPSRPIGAFYEDLLL